MIHPSYTELMKVVNSEVEPGEVPVVNSRYSIVMATSKEQDRSSQEKNRLFLQKEENHYPLRLMNSIRAKSRLWEMKKRKNNLSLFPVRDLL